MHGTTELKHDLEDRGLELTKSRQSLKSMNGNSLWISVETVIESCEIQ
jgi:hypothetical protein